MADASRLTPAGRAEARHRRALAEAEYRFEAGETDPAETSSSGLVAADAARSGSRRLLARLARIRHFGRTSPGASRCSAQAQVEAGVDPRLNVEIEEGLVLGSPARAGGPRGRGTQRALGGRPRGGAGRRRGAGRGARRARDGPGPAGVGTRDRRWTAPSRWSPDARPPASSGTRASPTATSCRRPMRTTPPARPSRSSRLGADAHGDDSALPPILSHLSVVEALAGHLARPRPSPTRRIRSRSRAARSRRRSRRWAAAARPGHGPGDELGAAAAGPGPRARGPRRLRASASRGGRRPWRRDGDLGHRPPRARPGDHAGRRPAARPLRAPPRRRRRRARRDPAARRRDRGPGRARPARRGRRAGRPAVGHGGADAAAVGPGSAARARATVMAAAGSVEAVLVLAESPSRPTAWPGCRSTSAAR